MVADASSIGAEDPAGGSHDVRGDTAAALRAEYEAQLATSEERARALRAEAEALRHEEEHAARRTLLLAEKDAVLHAHRTGLVGREASERLLREIDARLFRLEAGEVDHADAPSREAEAPRDEPGSTA